MCDPNWSYVVIVIKQAPNSTYRMFVFLLHTLNAQLSSHAIRHSFSRQKMATFEVPTVAKSAILGCLYIKPTRLTINHCNTVYYHVYFACIFISLHAIRTEKYLSGSNLQATNL